MEAQAKPELQNRKVYLVDGSGYIFRAYYAVAPLTTKAGFPTNALFGFTRMLLKLLGASDSDYVVMVFDSGRKTFRNDLYPEYKANRAECPEDLVRQMPFFREISSALGIPILELPGFEADDIIGTLATRLCNASIETVIISGDKDLMQLVSDHVKIWDTMRDRWFGRAEVIEKFGVPPEKVVEVLALTGDDSDNIPGLKGVGPKTAAQLVEKFGDVESIISSKSLVENASEIRNRKKIAELLESGVEGLRLSRKLVEIDFNSPVQFKVNGSFVSIGELSDIQILDAAKRSSIDESVLADLIQTLEFSSLIKDFSIKGSSPKPESVSKFYYQTILKEDFFGWWLAEFQKQSEFSFDMETDSLDPLVAKVVGASFCWNEEKSYYIPFYHVDPNSGEVLPGQISFDDFREAVRGIFENDSVCKIGHNLKFDIAILISNGMYVAGSLFDTMVASYLLNPDKQGHKLSYLAHDHLGLSSQDFKEVVGDKKNFSEVAIDIATHYSAEDALQAWLLKVKLEPLLQAANLIELFSKIETPLIPTLALMELHGVRLDTPLLSKMSEDFAHEIAKIEEECHTLAGVKFNLNSPKQLSEILFNKLAIPAQGLKKTKTGTSTDSDVLEKLSSIHPLPRLLLRYRLLQKLKGTYIDALPVQVSQKTGRLHARFNQTVTGTGRLSSSDPNLQNIPIQSPEGRVIRRAFIADDGCVILSADYSQIELRVLAHLTEDENLIEAFNSNSDIHAITARRILKIPAEIAPTPEQRRLGKTINFGVLYGMSGFRLGRELGIPVGTANSYIEDFFGGFPRVKAYFSELERQVNELGYVTTLFGRKRFVSQISADGRDKGFLLRAAINAPMQGTAADLVKIAMVRIHNRIRAEKAPIRMIMQIHDELVFEITEDFIEEARSLVHYEMENAAKLRVPLKVDIGMGSNWEEAHS